MEEYKYPNNFEIGISFSNNKKYEEAIRYLSKAIQFDFIELENEKLSEAYENRAYSLFSIQQTEQALTDLNKAIELNPENENALYNRGKHYLRRLDLESALRDLISAYNINSFNRVYIIEVAYVMLLKKQYLKVLDFLENNKTHINEIVFYYLYSAVANGYLKDYKKSIHFYTRALEFQNNKNLTQDLYNGIGFSYLKINELERADEYFCKSIDLEPQHAFAINNRGFIKYLNKKYDRALELINESIEFNQANSFAYKNRALVYLAINDKERAYQDLLFAKELNYKDDFDDEVDELLQNYFSDRA